MLISLSRWIFLWLVAAPIFPLACKSLLSVKISSKVLAQVVPGFSGQAYLTLAGTAASRLIRHPRVTLNVFATVTLWVGSTCAGQIKAVSVEWLFHRASDDTVTPGHTHHTPARFRPSRGRAGGCGLSLAAHPAQRGMLLQFQIIFGSSEARTLCI